MLQPSMLIADLFIMLFGLWAVWHGLSLLRASRSRLPNPGGPPPRLSAPTPLETRLRGSAFVTLGLSVAIYGFTALRYTHNHQVTVPPNAPLLDQLIWLLWHVSLGSTVLLVVALGWVGYTRHRRRRR